MSAHKDYITVNPGPHQAQIRKADAKRILLSVIAKELDKSNWQDAKPFLVRAETTDIVTSGKLGDNPQVLVTDNYRELQLAEKLEAALILAGVLRRTGTHVFYNGSVLYPPGPCAILVNKDGREKLKAYIERMQRESEFKGV